MTLCFNFILSHPRASRTVHGGSAAQDPIELHVLRALQSASTRALTCHQSEASTGRYTVTVARDHQCAISTAIVGPTPPLWPPHSVSSPRSSGGTGIWTQGDRHKKWLPLPLFDQLENFITHLWPPRGSEGPKLGLVLEPGALLLVTGLRCPNRCAKQPHGCKPSHCPMRGFSCCPTSTTRQNGAVPGAPESGDLPLGSCMDSR